MSFIFLFLPVEKPSEVAKEIFKSIFSENEVKILIEEQIKNLKNFKPGIVKIGFENLAR